MCASRCDQAVRAVQPSRLFKLCSTIMVHCWLVDGKPDVQVQGWRAYTAAVANLFDPADSHADLISIRPTDDHTIEMRWRLEGVLKLPGRPRIKPYTGTTRCALH